jgi:single-stranded DNA-binding protein
MFAKSNAVVQDVDIFFGVSQSPALIIKTRGMERLRFGMEENMTDKVIENNQVAIMGEIVSDFTFSHEIFGEGFYMVDISVDRLSESTDVIPVMMSERLLDVNEDYKGAKISIVGQFRSYNRHEERKNKLVLSVFAREIEFVDEIGENAKTNQIFLDGYICKPPIYRKTPLGREIADLLLAVNRPYGKSDYIPCICWGRNARFASGFEVGSRCAIWGRIQSREYMKKLSEEEMERRIAYEVSVSKLEIVEE